MATSVRAFTFSGITNTRPSLKPIPLSRHLLHLPNRRRCATSYSATVSCLSGGGVSNDDFVSTQKSNFDKGFFVIANMLKRIEPLDTSVISKGISDYAKDSMKRTISAMLGLFPSDQFSITVKLSKQPLHSLLVSSIITGYTLWNAEYRISLVRNFDISVDGLKRLNFSEEGEVLDKQCKEREGEGVETSDEDLDKISPQILGDISLEALNYIQQLQSDLSNLKQELNAMKQDNMQMEHDRVYRNDLLEYLRSLDPDMVNELSQPSSIEVEEIIHQLVESILRRFFKDDATSSFIGDSIFTNTDDRKGGDNESCPTIGTSRDYLAKLLFWCMLLGHHLRGLENRLHLTCVVGLL